MAWRCTNNCPKKGDLSECPNYRGIMLLSIVSNVLTKVLLKVGLKLNSAKTKSLKARTSNTSSIYKVGNETVENTDSFTYLGRVITTDGGAKASLLNLIKSGTLRLLIIIILARTPEIGQGLGRILGCGARKPEQT